MRELTDFLFDSSFLEEVIGYLKSVHSIEALVVDQDGLAVSPHRLGPMDPGARRLFAFSPPENLGGLLCLARTELHLELATPHIAICIAGINQLLQRESELRQAGDEILALSEQLHFLSSLADKIIGSESLQEFCTVIQREVGKAIGADYGLLRTTGPRREEIEINWRVLPKQAQELRLIELNHREAGERTLIFSLADGTSTLTSPIRGKEGRAGWMAFFRNQGRPPFTAYEKKFVSIIENIYSPSLDTIRLYDSLQELYLNTIQALSAAIDAKDEHTHGHSFRVARYALAIGNKMQLQQLQLADLEVAAYMHDLGKIGTPEAILAKPGKLSPAEFEEIKKHPVLTNKILEPIKLAAAIVDAAVHHHERLDGSGYPDGLQGEQISILTRIIAVADVFDALTSHRPYRPAMTVEASLGMLCGELDSKFDRRAVLALVSALQDDSLAEQKAHLDINSAPGLEQFLNQLAEHLLMQGNGNNEPPPAATN